MATVVIAHPAGGWGGAERTTSIIARALEECRINVFILTNMDRFRLEMPDFKHRIKLLPLNPWFGDGRSIYADVEKTYRLCKQLQPDIIVGIMPYGSFLTVCVSRLLRKPISIVSPRGSCRFYLKYFVKKEIDKLKYRFFFKVAFGLADYFFSPSKLSTTDYIKYFNVNPERCFIVPNGVHLYRNSFKNVIERRKQSFSNPQLLWVGRFSGEKFLEFILRSLSMIQLPYQLKLVGDGPELDKIREIATAMNLGGKVTFTGYIEDPLPYFLESHLYLHSCLFEEFGYTLAEALATGLPVVSRACPYGPLEVLDWGKYGLLACDELEMAEMIEALLSSFSLWEEFSKRAIKRAEDFDLNKVMKLYQEMFRCVLNGKNPHN